MTLFDIIFQGTSDALSAAKSVVEKAVADKGKEHKVAFPDTAYSLPVIYAATGKKISNLGELQEAIAIVESL